GRGVVLEAEGDGGAIGRFLDELAVRPPALAVIERMTRESLAPRGETRFSIVASDATGERHVPIAADVATCDDCLREIFDASDRRYRYSFANCTSCGPRFTIVEDVPYDRPSTTMAEFAMCADCDREYHDPSDRRFHAQPISCPACGPRLAFRDREGRVGEGE